MKMRWKYLAVAVGLLGMVGSRSWASNTDAKDATITVTPVGNVTISLTPSSYDFGNLDVNTSSVSAVAMSLANTGNVDVKVKASIQGDDSGSNWVSDTSSTTINHYRLWVATASARPNVNGSEFGSNNLIGKAVGNTGTPIDLLGLGGLNAVPTINPPTGTLPSVSMWYRLDMPTQVNGSAQRTTLVHFVATGQ